MIENSKRKSKQINLKWKCLKCLEVYEEFKPRSIDAKELFKNAKNVVEVITVTNFDKIQVGSVNSWSPQILFTISGNYLGMNGKELQEHGKLLHPYIE